MPRVPVYQNQADPLAPTARARFQAADVRAGEMVAAGVQNFGQSLGRVAEDVVAIEQQHDRTAVTKMANIANIQVDDVLDTGPDAYFGKRGFDAVGAEKSTRDALTRIRRETLAQARNPRQRSMFASSFDARIGRELPRVAAYARAQGIEEGINQSAARQVNMVNDAVLAGDDEDRYRGFIETAQGEAATEGRLRGWSVDAVQAKQAKLRSDARTAIVDRKMVDDPVAAAEYYQRHQGDILPAERLGIERALHGPMVERGGEADYAIAAATTAGVPVPVQGEVPAGSTPSLARMVAITAHSESRNRDFGADGKVLTSPKGAQGKMQTMPGTQRDPGFGVRPAQDDSVEEKNRVGRDYLAAMQARYRDPAKVWAAYNAGPGRLDSAVKQHGADWLAHMPAETQDYVKKNVSMLGGGAQLATAAYRPSMDDTAAIYKFIQDQPWDYERKQAALAAADKHAARNERLLNQQQQRAYDQAYRKVNQLGNGFTSINQIPGSLRQAMSPQQLSSLMTQAEQNAKPVEVRSNGPKAIELELMAIYEPKRFAEVDLREAAPYLSREELSSFAKDQAKMRVAPDEPKTANIRNEINSAIKFYGEPIGLGDLDRTKEKDAQRYMAIASAMRSYIDRATDGGKRLPTDDDYKRAFDSATMIVVQRDATWSGGDREVRRFEVEGGAVGVPIPNDVRARIVSAFRQGGVAAPTDQQISERYLSNKGRPGFWP